MIKHFPSFSFGFFLMVFLSGCAQVKVYTPQSVGTQYKLSGMPADLVRLQVNDLRAEKDNSDQLMQVIKGQILSALSPEKITGTRSLYNLQVDIVEQRAFFTSGNWNASTRLQITLLDPNSKVIGNWNANGDAHRSNMWGYSTAKAVTQDSYNNAVAEMMSILSAVSLPRQ